MPESVSTFEIDEEFVKARIPPRRRDSHKGMNGVVCIVGGSRTYHGAPFLCAMGAARTGVDLVYVAVPSMVATPIRSLSPDLIVIPLPDSKLTRGNASRLASWLPELDCIGIGPGLGPQNPTELKNALAMLSAKCRTLVVDADALRPSILEAPDAQRAKMVVTPHAKEFERLFGQDLPDALDGRVAAVKKAAGDHGLVVVVKGPTDVLTGVTSGLAAKGMARFEAACCAAYINGLAGAEAAKDLGMHIVASDVVACLPKAMKRFDRLE